MKFDSEILAGLYRKVATGPSLLDAFGWVKELTGFGDQTALVMDAVDASTILGAPTAGVALENAYYACKNVIGTGCAYNFQSWMAAVSDMFFKKGTAQGWTFSEIMSQLNRIVGQQHSLDGKLFEACVIMVLAHFLGKENLEFRTQQQTGSDFGGHTDVEVWVGDGHFLFEVTAALGSNWKRYVVEHWVPVTDDQGNVNIVHQPYFLVTPGFTLKERWLSAMDKVKCQPVSVKPSVLMGVASFDSVVDALKREIEKAKEQNRTQTV